MQVRKRDGRLEEFDRGKIYSGVVAAGLSEDGAESLASEVETWASTAAEEGVVSVFKVRDKVLELLRARDPEAAINFEEYKKE